MSLDDVKALYLNNLPSWYEMSWIVTGLTTDGIDVPSFFFRVREEAMDALRLEGLHESIIPQMRSALGEGKELPEFERDLERGFGFGGAIRRSHRQGDIFHFRMDIPQLLMVTGDCEMCQDREDDDERCFFCMDRRKKTDWDFVKAYALTGSLYLFFDALSRPPEKYTSKKPQLFTVQTRSDAHMHGAELSCEFGPALVEWLAARAHRPLPQMSSAMALTWRRIHGGMEMDSINEEFSARVDNLDGWLNVNVPGSGSGLNPHHHGIRPGRGCKMMSHNLDSPMQQLTLLAGLGALHNAAAAEIRPLVEV